MATWHYRELSLFPYAVAKPRLAAWDKTIRTRYPDIHSVGYMRMYERLPYPLYFCLFRLQIFTERVTRYLKRKLHF